MRSVSFTLHQRTDGSYRAIVTDWLDGQNRDTLLDEESQPIPEVLLSDAWTVAAQMVVEALQAREESEGLWKTAPAWDRTG